MTRKTIGSFIAVLRKASGLTQRDLAEKLNVSDKTVSRWERDEGTPDLTLIPVLAEIFGVTCDELLRGERRSPEERTQPGDAAPDDAMSQKATRQRQHLLSSALLRYKNNSCITIGITLIAFVAAVIFNLGLLMAIIGFAVAIIFLICGTVCQIIFLNNALSVVAGIDPDEDILAFRTQVIRRGEGVFCLILLILGVVLPLVTVPTYFGLSETSWLAYGLLAAIAFAVLFMGVCWVINARLVKGGKITGGECYWHNHRLQLICSLVLAGLLLVTVYGQVAVNRHIAASGTEIVFEDIESYSAYMGVMEDNLLSEDEDAYDFYGLEAADFPLTVIEHTAETEAAASAILQKVNIGFLALYCIELLSIVIVYRKKRMK